MAQSKKTGKKNNTAAKKAAPAKKSAPQPVTEPVVPIRREVGAVIYLLLAMFVGISYFKHDGAFIVFFSDLVSGLIGWGYWLVAPAFLLIAIILAFHRGRPVALRVFCAYMIPILFAAIMSLLIYDAPVGRFDFRDVANTLFVEGQDLESAGVLAGLLAIGLENAFSLWGALPVLSISLILCAICALRFPVRKVADKVKIQAQAKYDPAMYEDALSPIEAISNRVSRIERIQRQQFPMDIPLGDDEDEDILSLSNGTPAMSIAADGKAKKKTKTAKAAPVSPTVDVVPMSEREAAEIAGVELVDFAKPKEPEKNTEMLRPVTPVTTVSAEISDPPKKKKSTRAEVDAEAQAVAEAISCSEDKPDYEFPPLSLLRASTEAAVDARDEILINKERLDGAIRSFGIAGTIVSVTRGPTVTRYDIELEQGVKLARVTNLAGDLALALGVVNVRIAPIPDKISTVGIEVPNKIVSTVYLRDILESPKFANAKSRLSFALGKDIGGECIIGNISKLPHMLIAGTTGSGKSVCMNSLILSLLYKARPDEVKLIMIDPKMVELGVYNGIPHLYVPVVTDPKKAAGALQWSVVEMLKRYRLFSEIGVRDLETYNKHCAASGEATMPQVVIVIDELADLMLVASKEVEESICRVAQMGRAAGMHLVIATQRPSADVITGLMKANIPSRIAFAVSSSLESRIILDNSGAEKLIGMGDMLFSPVGIGKPMRVQGAFVSDEEREDVIQFIKEGSVGMQQNSEIEEFMNKAVESKNGGDSGKAAKEDDSLGDEYDELLPKAVEAVLEMKSCSASMLQRRVKLGYSRAARIVDQMEELGIVGPYEGAKPRQVIIDRDGWIQIQKQLGLIKDDEITYAENADDVPVDLD